MQGVIGGRLFGSAGSRIRRVMGVGVVREPVGDRLLISPAGRDTGWAEWLGRQLQQAGYGVELDV